MDKQTAKKLSDKLGVPLKMVKELEHRRTGQSTAQALELIAEAIKNPGVPVRVRDHFGPQADRFLLGSCEEIVHKLGFVGFTFSRTALSFCLGDLRERSFGVRF